MKSHLTKDFIACFRKLPDRIKRLARKNYRLWKANPSHSSLEFKRVSKKTPTYSVRVALGWRAVGLKKKDTVIWFWIGSHADYDKLLKQF